MSKHVICTVVASRPLESSRALSHRQADNSRQDAFSNPPRPPRPRVRIVNADEDDVADPAPRLFRDTNVYPTGLFINVTA